MTQLFRDEITSPIGTILLIHDDAAVYALDYSEYGPRMMALLERQFGRATITKRRDSLGVRKRLEAYFAGNLRALEDVVVNPGGTPFQQKVWKALRSIPPGRTTSYGELAEKVGCSRGARAVGLANSLNPVAIIVPCHRVIGRTGKLTGYAGGIDRKRWLLSHERGERPSQYP